MRRKVKSAFAYPIIVLCAATVVITFLVIFIIPIFADVYGKLHVTLPGPTLALITLSNFVRDFWWVILILIIAF